ncbi:MAG: type II/IV secretion system protein [Fimbriimonadaceae bacterium]|nr:type II/IV secretion system protein [Fimbriimonadaceae bacterium]
MHLERSIKDIVVEEGFVSGDQLSEILAGRADATENVGEMLVRLGLISEKQHLQCLGLQTGIPFADLARTPVDSEGARRISHQIAIRHMAIPVEVTEYAASVAMVNPLNIAAIDEIREQLGVNVDPMWASESDVRDAIFKVFGSLDNLSVLVGEFHSGDVETVETGSDENDRSYDIAEKQDGAPVIRLANALLAKAIRAKASDIHIEPSARDTKVRFRVDGILQEVMVIPKAVQRTLVSRYKVIAGLDIGERRIPQDGRFAVNITEGTYDLRVSTYPTVNGEKIVMRVLDKSSISIDLQTLGFSPFALERITARAEESQGLILVTGPTGSGKSTTLYSILNHLNDKSRNIVTIEDPVEYQLEGITQANVNNGAGMTFANGLRAILRQDPDVVLVGESRDPETAQTSIEAALTGHLVLTSLHANDSVAAVVRLLEMGIEPFLVSSSVTLSIGQRLVRVICPHCKETYVPDTAHVEALGLPHNFEYIHGAGCEKCGGTGYRGRCGIYEVMDLTSKIRSMIFAGESTDSIRRDAIRHGMRSMRQDAISKVMDHVTTVEEVLRASPGEDAA